MQLVPQINSPISLSGNLGIYTIVVIEFLKKKSKIQKKREGERREKEEDYKIIFAFAFYLFLKSPFDFVSGRRYVTSVT
jgi:hypothetical protein